MKKPLVATKANTDKRFRSVSFLIISVLLHLFLLIGSIVFNEVQFVDIAEKKKEEEPSVQFLDFADPTIDHKLVEQAEDEKASKNKPKDPKYQSKVDKQVEKETRAARHGEHQNANSKSAPEQAASQAQQKAQAAVVEAAPKSSEANMKTFEHGDMAVPKGEKVKKAVTIGDLRPNSIANMAADVAVSQTPDHLKDIAIGAETHLNTKEFLYYTYFNRIKKKLRQHWEPIIHTTVRDMSRRGRQIASNSGNKTTRVIITLDDHGTLTRVQMVTTSGLQDLDEAAIDALKEAAPFPNPPQGLIVEGLVKINWDFILES